MASLQVMWIALAFLPGVACQVSDLGPELTPPNGYYNNLYQPDWGAAGNQLLRRGTAAYSDGAYELAGVERPEALRISQLLHSGPSGQPSPRNRNALLAAFSQLVMDEIVDISSQGCPPEFHSLPVPSDHPLRNATQTFLFQRAAYDQSTGYSPNRPRQQQNSVTPFLDAGFLYGTSLFWTNALRQYQNGRLEAEDNTAQMYVSFPARNSKRLPLLNPPVPRDNSLKSVSRFFMMGNRRGHESPYLLALQVVWFRWHNVVANRLQFQHTDWSDDRIFAETRRRVTAHFQKIVIKEWLPVFLRINGGGASPQNPLGNYEGYDPRVHPGISQEFATGAKHYVKTLIPSGIYTREAASAGCSVTQTDGQGPQGEGRRVEGVRLCNWFWDSQDLVREQLDAILRGLVFTRAEREDAVFTADLRAHYHGPLHQSRQDAAALAILSGRDHGVADYNSVRVTYSLPSRNLSQISSDASVRAQLQILLDETPGGVGDIDLVTGGLLESSPQGPGELFYNIFIEQFTRIRDGDRFWYQNTRDGIFTPAEVVEIENVTFADILDATTVLTRAELPANVFLCSGVGRCSCSDPIPVDNGGPLVDVCSAYRTVDYFSNSYASFSLSWLALALVVPLCIGMLLILVRLRRTKQKTQNQRNSVKRKVADPNKCYAREWLGPETGERCTFIELDATRKKIAVSDFAKKPLRFIDLRRVSEATLRVAYDKDAQLVAVRIPSETDLILRFPTHEEREDFIQRLKAFFTEISVTVEQQQQPEAVILKTSRHLDDRRKLLDQFFRVVCLQALNKEPGSLDVDLGGDVAADIANLKLTRTEFADALGVKPNSIFLRNIFLLTDTNNDGLLSFQEFLDVFAVFAKGSAEEKARLLFSTYDLKRTGKLSKNDFVKMIRSLIELSDAGLQESRVDELSNVMWSSVGLGDNDAMQLEHFKRVFASEDYASTLQAATLTGSAVEDVGKTGGGKGKSAPQSKFTTKRELIINSYRGRRPSDTPTLQRTKTKVRARATKIQAPPSPTQTRLYEISRYIETYSRQIFWLTLYSLLCVGIFVERAYFYAVGREHAGLRRLSGAWVTAAIRGSASVIMFTYSSLLVTMSRNTITLLRETFLHRFIPFDSAVAFHKFIAWVAMAATIVHIVGHAINLYCMGTQPPNVINCLFTEYFTPSNTLPSFHYWAYQTITGLAGVLVTVVIFVMYVFAQQWARRQVFQAFWLTHQLYVVVYILTILHGIGRLVQAPLFNWYFLGPCVLFLLDKLASMSRNKVEITVMRAELLPSSVTKLVFKRPHNFEYRSGQWVRIACLELSSGEYHPFTLTSAPHEDYLSLHIRAVGPWTTSLRNTYDPANLQMKPYPKLYLDGPFGEGHQDWYTCDVAVLVGGGIGVTPFASILKDIAFRSKTNARTSCQKVYFIWVTRTQKSFEWMIDIIREVENTDTQDLVSVHIFVTQFQQKFDLRTTMLYICERHFQKIENRSLFTGLKAITHFGRPNFEEFLHSLHLEHPKVEHIGVFSCGPGPMTSNVQAACSALNKNEGPTYSHHFENF